MQRLILPAALLLTTLGCDDQVYSSSYHSPGWEEPGVHGLAAKLQEDHCTTCHGPTLDGLGDAASCTECHEQSREDTGPWTSDCTFCHGGDDGDATGAPPHDIDGEQTEMSFLAHRAHTDTRLHGAYGCDECHVTPEDAFTPGHLFYGDDTPGVAEVDLSIGLSSAGVWDGNGTCSDVYCHGTGRETGSVNHEDAATRCESCHAGTAATDWLTDAPGELSGRHYRHLSAGLTCADCHGAVFDTGLAIVDPALHVDGAVSLSADVDLEVSEDLTCQGACHDQEHESFEWFGETYHPACGELDFHEALFGESEERLHGMQLKGFVQTCTDCHGETLTGGGDAPSCDGCHDPDGDGVVDADDDDEDWRSHCSFCHGDPS